MLVNANIICKFDCNADGSIDFAATIIFHFVLFTVDFLIIFNSNRIRYVYAYRIDTF